MWTFGSCLYIFPLIYVFLERSSPWASCVCFTYNWMVFLVLQRFFFSFCGTTHFRFSDLAGPKEKKKKVSALGAPVVCCDDFIYGEQSVALLHFMRNDSNAVKCFWRLWARRGIVYSEGRTALRLVFSPGCCCQSSFYKSSYCFYTALVCRRCVCVCGADVFPHIIR